MANAEQVKQWLRSSDRADTFKALRDCQRECPSTMVPEILRLLNSDDSGIRSMAADTLGILADPDDKVVIDALRALLGDPDALVRGSAVISLADLKATDAVPGLRQQLVSDPDWIVRCDVAEALGNLGDDSAIPELTAALESDDAHVRVYAARALGQLGVQESVLEKNLIDEPVAGIQAEIIAVLCELNPNRSLQPLLQLISNGDEDELDTMLGILEYLVAAGNQAVRRESRDLIAVLEEKRQHSVLGSRVEKLVKSVRDLVNHPE